MPELPEVETIKRTLERYLIGKKVSSIDIYREKNIYTGAASFKDILVGKSIISMGRKGKYLIFNFSSSYSVLSHLRMEGKYFYFEKDYQKDKHDILVYHFVDGSHLVYNDTRKFGTIELFKSEELPYSESLSKVGKEAWELDGKQLHDLLKAHPNTPIKEALLDQSIIAGLGNIYVDETLFSSNVNPRDLSSSISLEECEKILSNSRRILETAIEEGGSTIKSYHPSQGIDGRMQNRLQIYGKTGEDCPKCGRRLSHIKLGGRGTTYCFHCQKPHFRPFVLAVTGPIHSGKSTVASFFESKGFVKLSCDEIISSLFDERKIKEKAVSIFGKEVLIDDRLNRRLILDSTSKDSNLDKRWKDVLYPSLRKKIDSKISSLTNKDKVVIEIPLLVDSGLEYFSDHVLLVEADEKNRKERLIKEGKDGDKYLELNKGYPLVKTKNLSSFIIKNDGDIKNLFRQLEEVYKQI